MSSLLNFAIIGAGMAGLSCATVLKQAGHTVRLFEKSRGLGGRMSTRRGEDWQCDTGAQYFTARDPDFRAEVDRWTDAGVAKLWTPNICALDGVSMQSSRSTEARFVGFPRMTAPANFLASELSIEAKTTVTQLRHAADGWLLHSTEQGLCNQLFDAVIIAIPAPQAVPLLQGWAPEMVAIASSAVMRGCWAVMLRFDVPVSLPFDAAFINAGPLSWIARDSSKPGRGGAETWLLHANAEWSERHLNEPVDSVAKMMLEAFSLLGGPSPTQWSAHRWRYADTEPEMDRVFAWDANASLGICGDWLNGGKVEGAWISGRALARRVLATSTGLR